MTHDTSQVSQLSWNIIHAEHTTFTLDIERLVHNLPEEAGHWMLQYIRDVVVTYRK